MKSEHIAVYENNSDKSDIRHCVCVCVCVSYQFHNFKKEKFRSPIYTINTPPAIFKIKHL